MFSWPLLSRLYVGVHSMDLLRVRAAADVHHSAAFTGGAQTAENSRA